ncbi:hypothetical protein BLNAU_4212 [Blattamonas nauphoetae]|uniref:Uncharacterized protein n=1 Tax=Blattamonas nauphoetae TaxID=2049346 RepID=A0ABQ9YAV4_9EUKA|nr:hypothetical protein BLNAU_4212 [Blattamonas nauphoetae]
MPCGNSYTKINSFTIQVSNQDYLHAIPHIGTCHYNLPNDRNALLRRSSKNGQGSLGDAIYLIYNDALAIFKLPSFEEYRSEMCTTVKDLPFARCRCSAAFLSEDDQPFLIVCRRTGRVDIVNPNTLSIVQSINTEYPSTSALCTSVSVNYSLDKPLIMLGYDDGTVLGYQMGLPEVEWPRPHHPKTFIPSPERQKLWDEKTKKENDEKNAGQAVPIDKPPDPIAPAEVEPPWTLPAITKPIRHYRSFKRIRHLLQSIAQVLSQNPHANLLDTNAAATSPRLFRDVMLDNILNDEQIEINNTPIFTSAIQYLIVLTEIKSLVSKSMAKYFIHASALFSFGFIIQAVLNDSIQFVAGMCRRDEGYCAIFNITKEEFVVAFRTYFGACLSISWSSDGQLIAFGGGDNCATVYTDLNTHPRPLCRLRGHTAWIKHLRFDPSPSYTLFNLHTHTETSYYDMDDEEMTKSAAEEKRRKREKKKEERRHIDELRFRAKQREEYLRASGTLDDLEQINKNEKVYQLLSGSDDTSIGMYMFNVLEVDDVTAGILETHRDRIRRRVLFAMEQDHIQQAERNRNICIRRDIWSDEDEELHNAMLKAQREKQILREKHYDVFHRKKYPSMMSHPEKDEPLTVWPLYCASDFLPLSANDRRRISEERSRSRSSKKGERSSKERGGSSETKKGSKTRELGDEGTISRERTSKERNGGSERLVMENKASVSSARRKGRVSSQERSTGSDLPSIAEVVQESDHLLVFEDQQNARSPVLKTLVQREEQANDEDDGKKEKESGKDKRSSQERTSSEKGQDSAEGSQTKADDGAVKESSQSNKSKKSERSQMPLGSETHSTTSDTPTPTSHSSRRHTSTSQKAETKPQPLPSPASSTKHSEATLSTTSTSTDHEKEGREWKTDEECTTEEDEQMRIGEEEFMSDYLMKQLKALTCPGTAGRPHLTEAPTGPNPFVVYGAPPIDMLPEIRPKKWFENSKFNMISNIVWEPGILTISTVNGYFVVWMDLKTKNYS